MEYMSLLPKILCHTIEHGRHLERKQVQLLSYASSTPQPPSRNRGNLAASGSTTWRSGRPARGAGDSLERCAFLSPRQPPHLYPHHQRYGSEDPSQRLAELQRLWAGKLAAAATGLRKRTPSHVPHHPPCPPLSMLQVQAVGTNTSEWAILHFQLNVGCCLSPLFSLSITTGVSYKPAAILSISSFFD